MDRWGKVVSGITYESFRHFRVHLAIFRTAVDICRTTIFSQVFYENTQPLPKIAPGPSARNISEKASVARVTGWSDFLTLFGDLESFRGSGLNIQANNTVNTGTVLCVPAEMGEVQNHPKMVAKCGKSRNDSQNHRPLLHCPWCYRS